MELQSSDGTGDTHYSNMRGTKAHLIIRQGKEENDKPLLYIGPVNNDTGFEKMLNKNFTRISSKFNGV